VGGVSGIGEARGDGIDGWILLVDGSGGCGGRQSEGGRGDCCMPGAAEAVGSP
jgi:hypothetical protein